MTWLVKYFHVYFIFYVSYFQTHMFPNMHIYVYLYIYICLQKSEITVKIEKMILNVFSCLFFINLNADSLVLVSPQNDQ